MARCSGAMTHGCDGTAVGLFRLAGTSGMADVPRALCGACRAAAERLGLDLVQDVSSWRARAIAKTLPGWVRAA